MIAAITAAIVEVTPKAVPVPTNGWDALITIVWVIAGCVFLVVFIRNS